MKIYGTVFRMLFCAMITCGIMFPSFAFAEGEFDVPPATVGEMKADPQYKKLHDLKGKSNKPSLSAEMKALRPKAIEETAQRVGVQEGYVWRYKQILSKLKSREQALDAIFDFGPLLLHGRTVMPPVITSADAYTEIRDPSNMVRVGSAYKILRPARFISVEPSWRDYLLVPEGAVKVEPIHASVLPTDSDEQAVWQSALDEGWMRGVEHADDMFRRGVNKLMVDMRGIIQYRVLEEAGYVSMPQVSRGHYAIRVGDKDLEFDQETFRIVEESKFKDAKVR